MVAFTETRESRAVELLLVERAVGVEEAMASTYGGGMTKNWVSQSFSEKNSETAQTEHQSGQKRGPNRNIERKHQSGRTPVRRTSVLAFEPLFA